MENQKKIVTNTSSTTPTLPQTKTGQVLHNFKFPADLKWGKNTSSANFSRIRRQGDSSSSSISPQRRPAVPGFGSPSHSPVLKYILGQNPKAASEASGSGSASQYPSPAKVSDEESSVINMLGSGFKTYQNKGENEEHDIVKNGRFSMTLPSPQKMVNQFKKGLIVSDKQGRQEKKKLNVHKKIPDRVKFEGEPVPRIDEGKELTREDSEAVPWTKLNKPLASGYKEKNKLDIHERKSDRVKFEGEPVPRIDEGKEVKKEDSEAVPWMKLSKPLSRGYEEKSAKIDDKESPKGLSSNCHQGQDEDIQVITGEFGDSERVPWNLRPRKPNQRPKVPKPCEAVGSSSKLGGKLVSEGKKKMPEEVDNDNSDPKKGKEKEKKSKDKRGKGKEKAREKVNNMPIMPNFSISLTPEEIEEDIFAMTGQKPSRKFKKRDKAVQDTLDQLFPGMQLKDITLNDYKTSDNP